MNLKTSWLSLLAVCVVVLSSCYTPPPDPAEDSAELDYADGNELPVITPPSDLLVNAEVPPAHEPATDPPQTSDASSEAFLSDLALDPTGQTIPSTNYPIPVGATFMAPNGNDSNAGTEAAPVRSIRRAVALTPEGGTIVLRGGEHRTWYSNSSNSSYDIVAKSLTFQAYPNESPWFNGADVVTNWTNAGSGRWSITWSTPTFCNGQYYSYPPTAQATNNTGPCSNYDMARDPQHPLAGDPQMVFIDGVDLRQVATTAEVGPGSFHYNWSTRVLTIGTNPANRTVEVSARPVAMVLGNNKNYTIRGIGFHRYASNQYSNLTGGAVYIGGTRSIIENVVFSHNAGIGLMLSTPRPGSRITKSVFAANGAIGLGANGSSRDGSRNDLLIEDSIFSGNNYEYFGTGCVASCAAGNVKLARMMGFTARHNVIENAHGPMAMGIWCDINCFDGVIVNNLVRNNGSHGIFYEISSRGIVASNVVANNGSVGISIGSATTKVYNNTVLTDQSKSARAQGIVIFDDSRYPNNPAETGPNTTGIELVNNVVSGAKGMLMIAADGPGPNNTKVAQFFNALNNNAYHHDAGEKFINWSSPDPTIGKYFKNLGEFRAHTSWDSAGIEFSGGADPFFVNKAGGDYRIRSGGPLNGTGAKLPADVASAIGFEAGVAVDRGALSWPQVSW